MIIFILKSSHVERIKYITILYFMKNFFKKTSLILVLIISITGFTSCETDTIYETEFVDREVIRTEIIRVYDAGSITISFPAQDSIQSGSTNIELFQIKIQGFNEYSGYRLSADFETNSGDDIEDYFSMVIVEEANNKLPTRIYSGGEFDDEDFRLSYRLQDQGSYFFDGDEHIISVYVDMNNFGNSEQIFLDQIELELERQDGYVEHYSELDTGNQGKTFFLVP